MSNDINEKLKMLETKVANMAVQQAQHQSIYVQWLDSAGATDALMMRIIMALITVVHVLFFAIEMGIGVVKFFVRTNVRILTMSIVTISVAVLYYQQKTVA